LHSSRLALLILKAPLLFALAAPLLLAQPAPARRQLVVDNASQTAQFTTLTAAQEASAPGDIIVLAPSQVPYSGGIVLKEGQELRGAEGVSAGAITVAKDVVITGIAASSISGTPDGHLRITNVKVATVKLTGGDGEIVLDKFVIDAAGTNDAVVIQHVTGSLTLSSGTIRNTAGHAIDIDGAQNVTIRDTNLIDDAGRNGVSASTCGGNVRLSQIALCNAPLFLQNATNVALERVVVSGSAQLGIGAENVNGLRMTDVEVKNAGNEPDESGVVLRNAGGDVVITGCRFHDSAGRELHIANTKADAHVRVDHCTFTHGDTMLAQALIAEVSGNASLTLDVIGSTISGGGGNGLHATATESGKLVLHVDSSTFERAAGAILAGVSGTATLDFSITGNKIRHSALSAINVSSTGTGDVHGTIARNEISGADRGAACGGCGGIVLMSSMGGRMSAATDSNTIAQLEGPAIRASAHGKSELLIAVTGNTIREPLPAADAAAIQIQSGASKTDTAAICADVHDNTITGTWSPETAPITFWNRFPGTTFKVAGFTGAGNSAAAVATYAGRNNRGVRAVAKLTTDPAGNAFAGGDRCVTP
jgi:hypothetical protein